MALELSEADLRPMEQFPLKWRWTDAKWNLLPAEELARITPLTEEKARQLRRYTEKWFGDTNLAPEQFASIAERDDQHDASPDTTRAWLSSRIRDKSDKVWVSFDNLWAVVTDADIFCRYWDDFCYPGSDLFIWAFSETWVLYYFHEETLYFGNTLSLKEATGER